MSKIDDIKRNLDIREVKVVLDRITVPVTPVKTFEVTINDNTHESSAASNESSSPYLNGKFNNHRW